MPPDLRYPIGPFEFPDSATPEGLERWIGAIESLPAEFRKTVEPLSAEQLDTPYRPGGWTVRQLVHHVPDSHLSSFVRFKWTLTEDVPTIKTYDEKLWAELPDSRDTPVEVSLTLLESLHTRWVYLLRGMNEEDWQRRLYHPEMERELALFQMAALYAWHGRHHHTHITALADRLGWASL